VSARKVRQYPPFLAQKAKLQSIVPADLLPHNARFFGSAFFISICGIDHCNFMLLDTRAAFFPCFLAVPPPKDQEGVLLSVLPAPFQPPVGVARLQSQIPSRNSGEFCYTNAPLTTCLPAPQPSLDKYTHKQYQWPTKSTGIDHTSQSHGTKCLLCRLQPEWPLHSNRPAETL
jgi:hypothetical protein